MILKKLTPKSIIKIICIILFLPLVYGCGCYFYKEINLPLTDVEAMAINEINGDIAIAIYNVPYAEILIFDCQGNLKHQFEFDNNGKNVNDMAYDQTGSLYLYLFMKKNHVRINPDGTYESNVAIGDFEYKEYYMDWQKNGSKFSKTVNGREYVYDYPGFWDYYGSPVHKVFINDANGTLIPVWSSGAE